MNPTFENKAYVFQFFFSLIVLISLMEANKHLDVNFKL